MSTPSKDEVPDEHESVLKGPEIELKIKASRFIGQVFPATNDAEVESALAEVRKRYHDARHRCFAWRLGRPEEFRELSQDDGEPGGTAGLPILKALQGADVFDALVVVTRYFGGTKLGTGGLVRAYGEAAREALLATPRKTVFRERLVLVVASYDDVGAVEAVLARRVDDIRDIERDFADAAKFSLRAIRSRAPALKDALYEATNGRAQCELGSDA